MLESLQSGGNCSESPYDRYARADRPIMASLCHFHVSFDLPLMSAPLNISCWVEKARVEKAALRAKVVMLVSLRVHDRQSLGTEG